MKIPKEVKDALKNSKGPLLKNYTSEPTPNKSESASVSSVLSDPMMGFIRVTEEDIRKQKGMKKGGYVKAADGVCKKGKTRGKMV